MSRDPISSLISSKWAQGTPYNNLCPIDPNTEQRCVTGCIATAMAQIMYYHRWPEQGMDSHSYEWEGQALSADFGATTYQWDKMKDTYTVDDQDPNDAVATLMYHCGVATDLYYSPDGTGAYITSRYLECKSTLDDVLTRYFNYSASSTTSDIGVSSYAEHDEIL